MKNRRFIQILGSAILVASLGITGCNVNVSKDEEETTKKETEETTTEEEEDLCGCCPDYEEDDEEYYCSMSFSDTNGELEGQMDYMVLCPDPETIDYENYPEDPYITDLSVIEDDDIRALAQSYMDQGYQIDDPRIDMEYGFAMGDCEYMFADGFSGYLTGDTVERSVNAYKMNETLFNYFLVDMYFMNEPGTPVTDDGTTIRYGEDDYYVEFNRETGIGMLCTSWDSSEGVG